MEGATGTFCNCQRANLSDERLLHAASRPRTTPAIIISYTIVSRSPRGGRGWVAGERVMAAICTLLPHSRPACARISVNLRTCVHTHALLTLRFFGGDDLRYVRGNIERVEAEGGIRRIPPFLEVDVLVPTIIINRFGMETRREERVLSMRLTSIRWN